MGGGFGSSAGILVEATFVKNKKWPDGFRFVLNQAAAAAAAVVVLLGLHLWGGWRWRGCGGAEGGSISAGVSAGSVVVF